ncbi:MAG: hypothetical protein MJZ65_02210 [Paludibacteraceae bacterium]|nr:hypothetical protein [Paludibacteraceae bacterium]
MAKISFVYPIEEIIGKLKDKFGAGRHKAANAKGLRDQWTVHYGTRTTPVTEDEMAARTRFAAVQAMVNTRKKDGTKRAQDQADFKAQSAYKTLTAYLWHVCGEEYDASLESGE